MQVVGYLIVHLSCSFNCIVTVEVLNTNTVFNFEFHVLFSEDDIKVGKSTEVEVSVRPRSNSGVVLLVWGGGDYLGIELNEGKVKVNVNNGAGDIEAEVEVPEICDGKWRKIKGKSGLHHLSITVKKWLWKFDRF